MWDRRLHQLGTTPIDKNNSIDLYAFQTHTKKLSDKYASTLYFGLSKIERVTETFSNCCTSSFGDHNQKRSASAVPSQGKTHSYRVGGWEVKPPARYIRVLGPPSLLLKLCGVSSMAWGWRLIGLCVQSVWSARPRRWTEPGGELRSSPSTRRTTRWRSDTSTTAATTEWRSTHYGRSGDQEMSSCSEGGKWSFTAAVVYQNLFLHVNTVFIVVSPCWWRNFFFFFCFRSDFVTLPFQGAEVLLDNLAPLPGMTSFDHLPHLKFQEQLQIELTRTPFFNLFWAIETHGFPLKKSHGTPSTKCIIKLHILD